jgi:diguanylate cyclase (GGDEF)-like protein/PAS domain S-box-containing protein
MRGSPRPAGIAAPSVVRRLLPLIVGVVVVAILAGTAAFVGRASLSEAKSQLLTERVRFVDQVGHYINSAAAPAVLANTVAAAPFSVTDRSLDALLLTEFRTSPVGDPVAVAALLGRTGVPLLTSPAGSPVDVSSFGGAWPQALAGRPVITKVISYAGKVVQAVLVPVGGAHPWAVLVEIVPSSGSSGQRFDSQLGALNREPGGLNVVDPDGVVYESWDAGMVGRRLLPAATVRALPFLKVRQWTQQTPQGPVVLIAEGVTEGYTLVFRQSEADLYGDLRHEQAHRDAILLALLIVTVTGLVLSHFLRERSSRRSRARLAALLANAQDLVLVVDQTGVLRFVSPSLTPLLGLDPAAWTGTPFLDTVDPADTDRVAAFLTAPQQGSGLLNVQLIGADGTRSWFDLEATDRSDLPEIAGTLITCHEAGQRKQLQDELHRQARHDALTGLANRTVLAEAMDTLVHQDAQLVTVIYVDLDDFKPVNDTLGHDVGDRVLKVASSRLAQLITGTGPGTGLVARLGGDEFAMLLPGCDEPTARAIAAKAIWAIREPIVTPMGSARVDASIGIAVGYVGQPTPDHTTTSEPPDVVHPEALLRAADQAMYAAKAAGKGSYALRWCHGPKVEPTGALTGVIGSGQFDVEAPVTVALPDAPETAASRTASGSRGRRLAKRGKDIVPLVTAAVVLVSLAVVDVSQETTARKHAEANRRTERVALTLEVANYTSTVVDPHQLVGPVSSAPWDMNDALLDTGLAQAVTSTAVGGPGSYAVLATTTGAVVASAGAVNTLPVGTGNPAWALALHGTPSLAGLVGSPPDMHVVYTVPIIQKGVVVGVLELGESVTQGIQESLLQATGSLGMGAGGLSIVDSRGVAISSYDPNLVGESLVDRTALAGLAVGATHLQTSSDGTVTIISPVKSVQSPAAIFAVFRQPASAFYGDIRVGQVLRDASLFLLVCIAVGGLGAAHRRREATTKAEQARLDALLENAHDIVVVLDAAGSPTFVSSAIQRLLGRTPATLIGNPLAELVHVEDRERFLNWLTSITAGTSTRVSLHDVRLLDGTGGQRWFDIEGADLRASGEVGGLLLTCHDSGPRKHLQDQLSFQAHHDMLTGLAHRGVFNLDLDELGTGVGAPRFAVLFIDLDHFKPVNDAFGHAAGDLVLSTVARRLQEQALPGERIYRLGGDEFAVIVTGADKQRAGRVADRVLLAIREPLDIGEHGVRIDATIGVALSHGGGDDATTVVREADHAMYQAKQGGRGRYAFAPEA